MDSGFTYLVVADDDCGRQMPFQFLEKVKTVFAQKFAGSINEGSVNAHSLDRTFGPTLKKEMEETMAMEQLSGGGGDGVGGAQTGSNKVASVQQQVSEVKEIMMDNIEKVLDRGEKIEVLVDKTEALRFQADNFHKQGRALRNRIGLRYRRRDYYFLRVLFRRGEKLHGEEEEQRPRDGEKIGEKTLVGFGCRRSWGG